MSEGLPTPEKLRRAIVRAFQEEGLSYEQIAHLLGIGEATVSRVLRLYRETGDVVLMDDLGAHKVAGVRQAVAAVGACVVCLPTCSPDFNSIEPWWADLKRQLRKLAPRALEELARTVRQLRAATPLAKLAAWFRHCLFFLQFNCSPR
ncbi:hypothetical protein D7X74_07995 [Corallococcus sp. CA047B]|uniref:transposase n=1 Tax=Corallococcus sp. CA047B TaxID=2316729 RepID=UPI000EA32EFD|nr:transposase [Corallococcus sp. CA047B]RKH18965.1 hypothetical protein D7X74_07995 [Corallococcus sp. CA047B]